MSGTGCHALVRYGTRAEPLFRNCRRCSYCRWKRVEGVVARFIAEATMRDRTFFATLTYDDKVSDHGHRECHEVVTDIQNLCQNLKYAGHDFKYVACAEKGTQGTKRLHWHFLMTFNGAVPEMTLDSDLRSAKNVPWGQWKFGHTTIREIGANQANAVSYAMKYLYKDEQQDAEAFGRMGTFEKKEEAWKRSSSRRRLVWRYTQEDVEADYSASRERVYEKVPKRERPGAFHIMRSHGLGKEFYQSRGRLYFDERKPPETLSRFAGVHRNHKDSGPLRKFGLDAKALDYMHGAYLDAAQEAAGLPAGDIDARVAWRRCFLREVASRGRWIERRATELDVLCETLVKGYGPFDERGGDYDGERVKTVGQMVTEWSATNFQRWCLREWKSMGGDVLELPDNGKGRKYPVIVYPPVELTEQQARAHAEQLANEAAQFWFGRIVRTMALDAGPDDWRATIYQSGTIRLSNGFGSFDLLEEDLHNGFAARQFVVERIKPNVLYALRVAVEGSRVVRDAAALSYATKLVSRFGVSQAIHQHYAMIAWKEASSRIDAEQRWLINKAREAALAYQALSAAEKHNLQKRAEAEQRRVNNAAVIQRLRELAPDG